MHYALTIIHFFLLGLVSCQSQSGDKALAGPGKKAMPGYEDLNVADFKAKMSEQDVVLLDVRSPEEIAAGKIEGALELDYYDEDFVAELDKLDKDKTYLVYCRSGRRSGKTCELMYAKGYTKLYNLEGGYLAWTK